MKSDNELIWEAYYASSEPPAPLVAKLRYNNAVNQILKDIAHHGKVANLEADKNAYELALHAFAAGYHARE
jgi:hypothetical protein